MSYRDQPGKHTGHVRLHRRAWASARQVGACTATSKPTGIVRG